ncbi:rho GTPase-activating protein SYDE2-like isoform X1 [Sinocyclocheilus rhinocerous]|uniref:rho GTPase-activating protein SYDE2-like isoform X1 n=1 Tax=Sinocyclocheilus rhinocerous TaxID=307959 RepID=UPI0007BA7B76|nr:PREDICTED: rho GTPase-activating protein SYDE2-like isoform X1 [Sinocyclocheilus rhinocerous]
MADPLRRTILAKLRGKKPKGKDASTANRPREGKEKVSQTQTERDYISHAMRGEERCVAALGCSAAPRCAVRVTGISGPGGPADQSERTELKRLQTPRVRGDSIGFSGCDLKPRREALKLTDGQDLKNKGPNVTLLEQKAGENITSDFERHARGPQPHVFDYIDAESDLIQVIESSLEYHGDFRMPALQSPTFFPTDLEITVAPVLREGAPRHHSVDSEDDDYYDNQTLPFYESHTHLKERNTNIGEPISASESNETDRLKSQLKEAYYLLINTMHNISFDGQVEDNGFVDQASSASQSHDSVSTESDACSSEERNDSAFLGRCGVGLTVSSQSRSLQNICDASPKTTLQRSVSDSKVKYSSNREEEPRAAVASGLDVQQANPSEALPTLASSRRSCDDAAVPKHPGVTVNKMQEWMQKGRVLSSEMKQRIAGSSLRANHVRQQTAPVESVCQRDSSARQAPFNHITVSKKRQWLQQSCARPEDVTAPPAAEEERTHPQTHPPSAANSRLTDKEVPDPAEENDAADTDEGEIWYNPIPEDEEGDLPNCVPAVRIQTGRARDETQTQEESRATDPSEQSTGGLSPSSSPNLAKRSTAINWSFPDKIKSPRTVRKLSMKMKKLPDLSRKLSVKGTPSSTVAISNGQSETRAHSPRANGMAELGQSRPRLSPAGVTTAMASGNVIWRYHLDSSVSSQHNFDKKRSNTSGVPKSASKGGYLSDGDSPELVAKSGKHGNSDRKNGKARDRDPNGNGGSPKLPGTELDIDAFRSYSFSEQPKCLTYISGLMSLHFYGAEDLKPPRVDSRDVYCAIQVDSVNKARTALLTCRTAFLDMDHTFNIELENAQHLKLVVFSWESIPRRNRVCCHGTVVLPTLFRVSKTHQLAVRLEPRGMIYVKLSLMEQRQNSLDGPEGDHEMQVFGLEARRVVEREASGLMVPLLIEKCISEIERRGCQVVGLYRLCGSAAVKKELREAFERDSHFVELSENNFPDINVITGVLKDFLRELPHPLITKQLYESVLDSMAKRPLQMGSSGCENDPADSDHAVSSLELLPEVEKATLRKLLDHLKRVASHHEVNKMTCQNLAVCFGPVLLSQRQEASCHGNRVFIDSEELASALHFKKHIEVLHYLLQLWPVVDAQGKSSSPVPCPVELLPAAKAAVRRRKERPQVLNLTEADMAGVLRPRAGRLDSPSNRYAGDWSGCQETYLQPSCPEEADYDDVPSEESPNAGQEDLSKGTGDVISEQELPEVDEGVERVEEMQIEEEEEESEEENTIVLDKLQVEEPVSTRPCDQILPDHEEHQPKEHTYQAYMKIQEISPVLSNRVNLRDLQESIDTLIGNLERELNKNKLNIGY